MFVVGVLETEGALVGLPAFHEGIIECALHLRGEPLCSRCGLLRVDLISLGELASLMGLQLFEDRVGPQRPIQALDRQRQQKVTLEAGPQNTRIQDGGEHAGFISALGFSASLGNEMADLAQLLAHLRWVRLDMSSPNWSHADIEPVRPNHGRPGVMGHHSAGPLSRPQSLSACECAACSWLGLAARCFGL